MNKKVLFLYTTTSILALTLLISFSSAGAMDTVLRAIDWASTGLASLVLEIFYYIKWNMLRSKFFILCVLAILLIEWLKPAVSAQKIISIGLLGDFVWMVVRAITAICIINFYISFLYYAYESNMSFLRVDSFTELPLWAQITIAILLSDLLEWFSHMLTHKVPILWKFHQVHHSQQELNIFTEFREHPVDGIMRATIRFIPMLSLEPEIAVWTFVGWSLFKAWQGHFIHGNVKTNLGWLRYVMISPQAHRIHHSIDQKHYDKNFGVTFSIWDQIFNTYYRKYDEYPQLLGIKDDQFPVAQKAGWAGFILIPFRQIIYPFRFVRWPRSILRRIQ